MKNRAVNIFQKLCVILNSIFFIWKFSCNKVLFITVSKYIFSVTGYLKFGISLYDFYFNIIKKIHFKAFFYSKCTKLNKNRKNCLKSNSYYKTSFAITFCRQISKIWRYEWRVLDILCSFYLFILQFWPFKTSIFERIWILSTNCEKRFSTKLQYKKLDRIQSPSKTASAN